MVAIVTPFKDGKIDEPALRGLVEFQIENGTDAIVPCGTTGESATLNYDDHQRVIEIVIDAVNKRVPVIAGTGANCTEEAIEITKHAHEAGADGSLQVSPYYNKPTQEGLYRHYKAIAEAVDIPIILYNVPGRTSVNILPETVARLAEIENIVAIKEACGDMVQIMKVVNLCGDKIDLLSGDDALFYSMLCIGGKGVISVSANIVPDKIAALYDSFAAGEVARARSISDELLKLNNAMFIETNPAPVKTALHLMGKISPELKLPLCEMSEANADKLKDILREYGLIN
jgi:4-hydroxy-tetrahydrodipicolinate synthase